MKRIAAPPSSEELAVVNKANQATTFPFLTQKEATNSITSMFHTPAAASRVTNSCVSFFIMVSSKSSTRNYYSFTWTSDRDELTDEEKKPWQSNRWWIGQKGQQIEGSSRRAGAMSTC